MFHRVFKPYTPFALVSLRSHARARPRCVYWHFPVLSADGLRHSKQVPASAKGQNGSDEVLVGGANVTVNGTRTAVYGLSSVVRRFVPTVGTVSLYPTSAFAYKLPEI